MIFKYPSINIYLYVTFWEEFPFTLSVTILNYFLTLVNVIKGSTSLYFGFPHMNSVSLNRESISLSRDFLKMYL